MRFKQGLKLNEQMFLQLSKFEHQLILFIHSMYVYIDLTNTKIVKINFEKMKKNTIL